MPKHVDLSDEKAYVLTFRCKRCVEAHNEGKLLICISRVQSNFVNSIEGIYGLGSEITDRFTINSIIGKNYISPIANFTLLKEEKTTIADINKRIMNKVGNSES